MLLLPALLLFACGPKAQTWTDSHTGPQEDAFLVDADFGCIAEHDKVGNSHYWNVNGHTEETLRVAREGGVYPVGTVVQLAPVEAMVKRHQGFSPETGDWEFFKLKTAKDGQRIITERGTTEVGNIAGNCARCHAGAQESFDWVCGTDRGCKPLPGFVIKAGAKQVAKDPLCGE